MRGCPWACSRRIGKSSRRSVQSTALVASLCTPQSASTRHCAPLYLRKPEHLPNRDQSVLYVENGQNYVSDNHSDESAKRLAKALPKQEAGFDHHPSYAGECIAAD